MFIQKSTDLSNCLANLTPEQKVKVKQAYDTREDPGLTEEEITALGALVSLKTCDASFDF